MSTPRSAGRPKAISREMLEEAACELFLEQGYERTSVADITRRAGVSRATFFNYVDSKAGLLWASVDDAIAAVEQALAGAEAAPAEVRRVLVEVAGSMPPGVAVLAIANAQAMGVAEELVHTGAGRQARLALALAESFRAAGREPLEADVLARADAGAFFAALESWALGDPGVTPFALEVERALDVLRR